MAQMCGATAIKYYLPTLFLALGLSQDLSLMAGGIESTLKIGFSIVEMLIIDKLGRRRTLLLGSTIMSFSMLVCSFSLPSRLHAVVVADWYRSMAHCRSPILTISTELPTTPASYSFSSLALATRSVSGLMHGSMVRRCDMLPHLYGLD